MSGKRRGKPPQRRFVWSRYPSGHPSVPIDQNTARFHGRVAYDLEFGSLADDENEGKRLAETLADHRVLMMGNHGVTVAAETVASAFEEL